MKAPKPRCFRGFRDIFASELLLKQRMVDTVRAVYESYGFLPLETPAVEYVDALGKFLPEAGAPGDGIFSFQNPDLSEASAADSDPDRWLAMRYDLTAPLARVVAQYQEIPQPFRRYQVGTVWRYEKPGPGRYREFTQFDFDTVNVPSMASDAEACCIICDVLEALGFEQGDYIVRVNNRKVLQGVLEVCGIGQTDLGAEGSQASIVLRAIDKLDRLGMGGVIELLGKGRKDKTGDFTDGANLEPEQIARIEAYFNAKLDARSDVCATLEKIVAGSEIGTEGVTELREIDSYLEALEYDETRVIFDPTVVRGLAYYTGPVFEGVLTKEVTDEKGKKREFGSVYGGGRYDGLVERFTGQRMPATGASVGVDRLLQAMKLLTPEPQRTTADVLVTTMDKARMTDYFKFARRLREAGLAAEIFLGSGGIGRQLKYANKAGYKLVTIAGEDEFESGTVQIKNLEVGRKASAEIESREQWRTELPGQVTVSSEEAIQKLKEMVEVMAG